jgi:CheY-like chemotaxis protein
LPEGWVVEERAQALQAIEYMEGTRPDLILADLNLSGVDGLSFLKIAQQRFAPLPPTVFITPAMISTGDRDRLEELRVSAILRRAGGAEEARAVLGPLIMGLAPPPMGLIELIAAGYPDPSARELKLNGEGWAFSLFFGDGKLWALEHSSFLQGYAWRLGCHENGPPPKGQQYLEALARCEAAASIREDLVQLKRQCIVSLLVNVPPDLELAAKREPVTVPPGMVPVDVARLLLELVDCLPESYLADLRSAGLKVRSRGAVIARDLDLLPHHGYLLAECSAPTSVEEIIQTRTLPERQVLSGLYLLVLLGLMETVPPVSAPFQLKRLRQMLQEQEYRAHRETEAIQALLESFQVPGQSPYQILGVASEVSFRRLSEAYQALDERLHEERLHPEVYRKHQKDILFLRAKLQEAFLLVQATYLQDKLKEPPPAAGEPADASGSRSGDRGADVGEAQVREAEKLLSQAKFYLVEEKVFEASQYLKLALFHNPGLAEAHNKLGRIYEASNSPRAKHMAENELLQAAQLAPTDIDYLLDLAEFYANNNLYNRCRTCLNKAQALNIKHPRAVELRKSIKGKE